jgi:hypothetical protein
LCDIPPDTITSAAACPTTNASFFGVYDTQYLVLDVRHPYQLKITDAVSEARLLDVNWNLQTYSVRTLLFLPTGGACANMLALRLIHS